MKKTITVALAVGMSLAGLSLTACSSSASGPASENLDSRGPITYVQGKDNNGVVPQIIAKWNASHPNEQVTLKEQSTDANQQHDDLVQNFQAKNANYDVVSVDVVWTSEFAAKGWLQPLTGSMALPDQDKIIKAGIASATYNGTQYAAPVSSDGGLLYYRSDLIQTPPTTWDEMMADCKIAQANNIGCYAGQFAQYEGLTVNVAEQINGAGGSVVAKDGVTPTLNTDQAKKAMQQLVDAFNDGNIPQSALTYKEEDGRAAFEAGQLLFLRNWPYMYSLASTDATSVVKGKFAVAPLVTASTLGGHSAGISVYSKHKATAKDFLTFLQSEDIQKNYLVLKASNAPVLSSIYDDPDVIAAAPYMPYLKASIENAVPRPVTPYYPAVTQAIQQNSFSLLSDPKNNTVADTLNNMQNAIKTATSGK